MEESGVLFCLWCGTKKIELEASKTKEVFPLSMIKKILRERHKQMKEMIIDHAKDMHDMGIDNNGSIS